MSTSYPYNKNLAQVSAETKISLSLTSTWHRMRDLKVAHHYVPGATATEITTTQTEGVGTVRKVHQGSNNYVVETVMEWLPQKGFLLSVHRGANKQLPAPIESIWFRYQIYGIGRRKDICACKVTLYYSLRYGRRLHWLRPLFKIFLYSYLRRLIRKLKLYYEIGYNSPGAAGSV